MKIQSPYFGPVARLDIPVYYDGEDDGCGWFDLADRFARICVDSTAAFGGIDLLMEAADQAEEIDPEPDGHCWQWANTYYGVTIWFTMTERMDLQTRAIREGVAS